MSNNHPFKDSLLGSSLAAFLAFVAVNALTGAVCTNDARYQFYKPIDQTATALGVSALVAIASFVLLWTTLSDRRPSKFDKFVCLAAAGWTMIWLGLQFVGGDFCSTQSARSAGAYLFVPIALMLLAILGKRWIASDND